MVHLDIKTSTDFSIENDVKIDGNIVNKTYFSRGIIRVIPSPQLQLVVVTLSGDSMYALSHDQACINDDVYIVDSVDGVAPNSMLDLASKINALIKF